MTYSYYSFLGEALAGGALYKGIKGVQTGEEKHMQRVEDRNDKAFNKQYKEV